MPLPAATTRSPGGTLCEAPLYVLLKHPSRRRSDPWGFVWGVGWPLGRWVLWALGCGQGRPGGVGCCVGCSRAATTRSTGRILCEASLDVARGTPAPASRLAEGSFLGVGCLGVGFGRWVLGVGCAAGSPPGVGSTTRPLCESPDG
ncbi:UNVERIFIED_CONTAM: hypothetical protein Sradi_7226800 [Sesamum radiatum]|uniref:Uncharacterized protein n=1 Tax=Sesamum radiatum TaxID=300843 RepID=A0AAW2IP81_SESRA